MILRRSNDLPDKTEYVFWLSAAGAPPVGDPARKLPHLARRLEEAFDASRDTWLELARDMGGEPTGEVSHTASAGAFGSDFGLMLAWTRLVSQEYLTPNLLIICDDPWLFRHLATLPGVSPGVPPPLFAAEIKLYLRGFAARSAVALRMATAAVRMRSIIPPASNAVLLVYGHPASNATGGDAYFADLMAQIPSLGRMLHTDCRAGRALELAADERTGSLHGFGNPLFAMLALPWVRWRPSRRLLAGKWGMLIRRAAAKENGGGGPASNRWQIHCQERWLAKARPRSVAWPWENHAWERALCRSARRHGVATIGHQHTVIGRHQINYATRSNPDGLASIPDTVVANGPAYRDEMILWGMPTERLHIGGVFRIKRIVPGRFDPAGPVFVPLSAIPELARLQVEAARIIAASGRKVMVKEHPMYPFAFSESANLIQTEISFLQHSRISAVIYTSGTSGLEGILAGVPSLRLLGDEHISIDVLPKIIAGPSVTLDNLLSALATARPPPPIAWEQVFTDPDMNFWRDALGNGIPPVTL